MARKYLSLNKHHLRSLPIGRLGRSGASGQRHAKDIQSKRDKKKNGCRKREGGERVTLGEHRKRICIVPP